MPWWNDIFKSKKAYKACQNYDVLGNNVVVVERVSDGKVRITSIQPPDMENDFSKEACAQSGRPSEQQG